MGEQRSWLLDNYHFYRYVLKMTPLRCFKLCFFPCLTFYVSSVAGFIIGIYVCFIFSNIPASKAMLRLAWWHRLAVGIQRSSLFSIAALSSASFHGPECDRWLILANVWPLTVPTFPWESWARHAFDQVTLKLAFFEIWCCLQVLIMWSSFFRSLEIVITTCCAILRLKI